MRGRCRSTCSARIPHQPRSQFDPASLNELADSIRVHGVIQPLVVTPALDQPGHYWIIAGERRWRAARLADLQTVPVLVRDGFAAGADRAGAGREYPARTISTRWKRRWPTMP